jgi:hypothetical protein
MTSHFRPYKIDEFLAKYPFGTVITIKFKDDVIESEYTGMVTGYKYSRYLNQFLDMSCLYHISIGGLNLSLHELFQEYVIIEDGQEKVIGVQNED